MKGSLVGKAENRSLRIFSYGTAQIMGILTKKKITSL